MTNPAVLAFTRFQNNKDLILCRNSRGSIFLDLRSNLIPILNARIVIKSEELAYKTFEEVSERMEFEEKVRLFERDRNHAKGE